jgi:hypothetical protein
MPASTERILVSHAGALPRPDALQRLFGAGPGFQDAIDAALAGAVAEVVDRQASVPVWPGPMCRAPECSLDV